jgi:hypothetical protein
MMSLGRWLPCVLALGLEPAERDAVLGDVANPARALAQRCAIFWV